MASRALSWDPDVRAGLQQSVVNPRGRSRGFHENCLFLTLFCSLYKEAAAEMDTLCAHLATSRAPCARPTRAHPCGCLAVSTAVEDPRVNITKLTRRANDLLRAKHENSTAKVAKAEKMRNAKKWKEMDELLFGGPKFKGQAKKDGP